MDYICRKCRNPVKNKEQYDLFEGMHWLCFHFEFEHGEYDGDEPCDDPSCPWNVISGGNIDIINTYSDAKLKSESLKSSLYLNLKSIEPLILPSWVIQICFYDEHFRTERVSWFEDNEIKRFIDSIEMLENGNDIVSRISAMSPNEFELSIKKLNSRGYYLVEIELSITKLNNEYESEIRYRVTFDVLLNELIQFKNSIRSKILY